MIIVAQILLVVFLFTGISFASRNSYIALGFVAYHLDVQSISINDTKGVGKSVKELMASYRRWGVTRRSFKEIFRSDRYRWTS